MPITPIQRREKPDFSRFLKVIRRQGGRDYVPFMEMLMDTMHFEPLSGLKAPQPLDFNPSSPHFESSFAYYLNACARMGFDHGTINICGFGGFPAKSHGVPGTVRNFVTCEDASIHDEVDFDSYPWPSARTIDTDAMERTVRLAPEGMGVLTGGPAVFQTACGLLGYNGIAMMLYENPELVWRVVDRIGETMTEVFNLVASLPFIQGVLISGDMGFKTGTFLSPDDLRRLFFPWHRKFNEAVHAHGKFTILHSCGNLQEIMPDILSCGYDAKHSFEDAFEPSILDLHKVYGRKICLIGGLDVDFICRADEQSLRKRIRQYIDAMAPNGGYILGSGNGISDYVPTEQFRIILDEGLKYGRV